jgi:hypothetical protein
LRHGVDWNQWLVRAEGKSTVVVADQSVPQVGRPTVQKIEEVLLRGE